MKDKATAATGLVDGKMNSAADKAAAATNLVDGKVNAAADKV